MKKKMKKGNDLYIVVHRSCDYPDKPIMEIIGYLPAKVEDLTVDTGYMITVKTEKDLIEHLENQDSDESDWLLIKFTPDEIEVVIQRLGYYKPRGEE